MLLLHLKHANKVNDNVLLTTVNVKLVFNLLSNEEKGNGAFEENVHT